jgi:MarR family transcriptional regulator for hemolysin
MSNDIGYDGTVRPTTEPIGLDLTRTGRLLSRAFDDELVAAGASLPVWLVLTALKRGDHAMQRQLAAAVGIDDATLTHHLRRMEADGLVARHRAPDDRRNQVVELTAAGDALFGQLLGVVTGFDRRLRAGFGAEELAALRASLAHLRANVGEAAVRAVPDGQE